MKIMTVLGTRPDKIPTLYMNGHFVKTGLASSKKKVVPSGTFWGMTLHGTKWHTIQTSKQSMKR